MKLKQKRELLFRILFSHAFDADQDINADTILSFTRNEKELEEEEKTLILDELSAIRENLPRIDEILNQQVERWNTQTMAKVELAILRVMVYEMFFKKEAPVSVLANDAVQLAAAYGQDNSYRFVNGAMAKLIQAAQALE